MDKGSLDSSNTAQRSINERRPKANITTLLLKRVTTTIKTILNGVLACFNPADKANRVKLGFARPPGDELILVAKVSAAVLARAHTGFTLASRI